MASNYPSKVARSDRCRYSAPNMHCDLWELGFPLGCKPGVLRLGRSIRAMMHHITSHESLHSCVFREWTSSPPPASGPDVPLRALIILGILVALKCSYGPFYLQQIKIEVL